MTNMPHNVFALPDMRLTRLMTSDPERCATVNEYAEATGTTVSHVINVLGPALDSGVLKLEPVGSEIFVHTAAHGRPVPGHLPDAPPNLWERLRSHSSPTQAAGLWQQVRELQSAGWSVVANPQVLSMNLAGAHTSPKLGLVVRGHVAPLLLYPTQEEVTAVDGSFLSWAKAGASVIAALCASGDLDDTTTAIRSFYHQHGGGPVTVVCEAPRYHPVIVTPGDVSVAPRSVSVETPTD